MDEARELMRMWLRRESTSSVRPPIVLVYTHPTTLYAPPSELISSSSDTHSTRFMFPFTSVYTLDSVSYVAIICLFFLPAIFQFCNRQKSSTSSSSLSYLSAC